MGRSGLDRFKFYRVSTGLRPKNFTVRSSLLDSMSMLQNGNTM